MKPIAIIIPWWGKNLKGGAEQQAYQLATRLANLGHTVEVLTTCCRSFMDDWSTNHFKEGVKKENGLTIRRFPVNKRNNQAFDWVNFLMLNLEKKDLKIGVSPVSLPDSEIFARENINSNKLIKFLEKNINNYHAFIFIPYLYGIILNGLPIVAKKAFLQPCLHDEVYAYLPQVENIFHQAKGLLFNSEGELKLAEKLYGCGILKKNLIVGEGVEIQVQKINNVKNFLNINPQTDNYILYLGRRDATKNTDLLLKAYGFFKQKYANSNCKLVLAGTGDLPKDLLIEGIIDLGLVTEEEKAFLLQHCLALFQPSQNESYSRVIMEAWFYQRPVAVNKNCLATAIAVKSSNGGYLAETEAEWADLFFKLTQASEERLLELGKNGYLYAQENGVWDKVIERYEKALNLIKNEQSSTLLIRPKKLKTIHQLLPNLSYGDAISNQAILIRDYLREIGYKSDIFVRYIDKRLINEAKIIINEKPDQKAGLIYHHSIGCHEITQCAIDHPQAKCLVYHNITPAEFFEKYDTQFAQLLTQGRQELKALAYQFSISVGVSNYNALELKELGFKNSGVLANIVDSQKWAINADPFLMKKLQDGKKNIIFVGRIAPNKKQDDLVKSFAKYLTMDANTRLILIGDGSNSDDYYCYLLNLIKELSLTHYVTVTGKVDNHQLLAYYRTADLYWSMSEHEGFGVPLVEAMWFNVPVLAYKSSAIPETLEKAGLMFNTKEDLVQVAALAKLLVHDYDLRDKVINAQNQRRNDFLLSKIKTQINHLIMKLES
jgi:glycosyltransferase involved in cell wall biosynthesis